MKAVRIAVVAAGLLAVTALAGVARPEGATSAAATEDPSGITVAGTGAITTTPDRATVSFAESGKVASVVAQLGQHVAAGQMLAQLDMTTLNQQLQAAQADVAKAQQTLAADTAAQLAGTTSSSSAASTSSSNIVRQHEFDNACHAERGNNGADSDACGPAKRDDVGLVEQRCNVRDRLST